jgi:DNA-binding HxlR family transcriptional regulator
VDGFRYPQFCALARAAEILGERWTLPLIRELMVGPQRFSDLRRRLTGVSPSVLATRLARLEALGIVTREALPPPAASQVYALSEAGRGLEPVLRETMRWGMRFLGPPQPGDHFEPDWIPLAFRLFARKGASPARSFEVCIVAQPEPIRLHLRGGRGGTRISEAGAACDLSFSAAPLIVLGLASGSLDGPTTLRSDAVRFEGDPEAIGEFSALFDMSAAAP